MLQFRLCMYGQEMELQRNKTKYQETFCVYVWGQSYRIGSPITLKQVGELTVKTEEETDCNVFFVFDSWKDCLG